MAVAKGAIDLMGDGVNIAARLEGIAEPGAICLSEDAYRQVKGRLDLAVSDQEHRGAGPSLFARSRQADDNDWQGATPDSDRARLDR